MTFQKKRNAVQGFGFKVEVHIAQFVTSQNTIVSWYFEKSQFDPKNPPPPGGFPIYYVPSSRTVSKRTPLEEFVPGASSGVLLLIVLDEGT